MSCHEPLILKTFKALAISPLISTYWSNNIVSVIVEIWESVIEWLPINSSAVFVKKPAISSCFEYPVTPITNCLNAFKLTPLANAERESIAILFGLNWLIWVFMICKWSSRPVDSGYAQIIFNNPSLSIFSKSIPQLVAFLSNWALDSSYANNIALSLLL